ncbi:unnamed protein product [Merluccius merluccius]
MRTSQWRRIGRRTQRRRERGRGRQQPPSAGLGCDLVDRRQEAVGYAVLLPGRCWAFRGAQGTLVLSLSHRVAVSHVTLDHLPRYSAPTGRIESAPRDFQVYGMVGENLEEAALLGNFTYDQEGEATQTFQIPESSRKAYRHVELRVLSNWGHMTYTCVYRFRVHGKMAAA